ncbi:MAG: hypothetical protein J3R72DRAFT_486640 [Linnemannia gamsii]|nr:MAG: hypothetical protein J3R72DRAFT_486640 [Linnemannia gamsii]
MFLSKPQETRRVRVGHRRRSGYGIDRKNGRDWPQTIKPARSDPRPQDHTRLQSPQFPDTRDSLNQCGNLRHIDIKAGISGTAESPEKQPYPARLIWSSMFPEHQGGGRRGGNGGGGGCEDGQQHWTFWDLLPLEGFLFDRLESLTIEVCSKTQLNLDRFMPRLGQSGAAKTLRALTVITLSDTKKVSWEIFRDCICNLSVLKTLHMHLIEINYTKDSLIDSDDGSQHKMETQLQQVAPTVNSLKCQLANCNDPSITLAFMRLFPNLESLELFGLDSLLDKAVEERIYSEVGRQLPLQQSLWTQQHSTGSAPKWVESQVLRHWIQRAPNFRLACLCVFDQDVKKGLHEELSAYSVSLAQISIEVNREESVKELLSSRLCRNLEVLGFNGQDLDCVSVFFCLEDPLESTAVIVDQAGSAPPSQPSISDEPLLSQQDLFTRFAWTQTLTTLCLRTLVHPSRSKDESDRSVAFMRSFLKILPRLVDFEVMNPIMDLSFFDGLGRQSTTSSGNDPTDAATLLERPWLTRLSLCQSNDAMESITDRSWSVKLAPWSRQLSFQFRFLKNLDLVREYVGTGNGGYDPSNFVGGVDYDLY